MLFVLGLAVMVGAGCDDTGSSDEPLEAIGDKCSTLSEADCEANGACMAFRGRPLNSEEVCLGAEEFIVCGPSHDAECNNSTQGAILGPAGQCWVQSRACFSEAAGYSSANSSECGDGQPLPQCEEVDCSALDESGCEENPNCMGFYGKLMDREALCLGPHEFIVCGPSAGAACNNASIGAIEGPNGECWLQGSPCFTVAPGYSGQSGGEPGGCWEAVSVGSLTSCE